MLLNYRFVIKLSNSDPDQWTAHLGETAHNPLRVVPENTPGGALWLLLVSPTVAPMDFQYDISLVSNSMAQLMDHNSTDNVSLEQILCKHWSETVPAAVTVELTLTFSLALMWRSLPVA